MPDFLYFIWALLPVALLWITVRAATNKAIDAEKKEYPKLYFRQFLFSVILLVLSIWIDKKFSEELGATLMEFGVEPKIVRWLIYPAIMTLVAVIQQFFKDRENVAADAEKKARRMKYAKH